MYGRGLKHPSLSRDVVGDLGKGRIFTTAGGVDQLVDGFKDRNRRRVLQNPAGLFGRIELFPGICFSHAAEDREGEFSLANRKIAPAMNL
jgi:hypothetical protein